MPVASLSVGDILQCTHVYEVDGQTCMNVCHFKVRVNGGGGEEYVDQIEDIALGLANQLGGFVKGWQEITSTDNTSRFVQVQRVRGADGGRSTFTRSVTEVTGNLTGPSLPSVCALSITRRTELAARGRSGHVQIGGIPISEVSEGRFTPAAMASFSDYVDWFRAEFAWGTGGFLKPILWNPPTNPLGTDIIMTVAQSTVRSMHRRTVGLGI